MAKKGGDYEAPAIPRRGNAKAYRCRTEFSCRILETSKRYGPGLMITTDEYNKLIRDGLARAEWFEAVASEGEA